eukprot:g5829.t1
MDLESELAKFQTEVTSGGSYYGQPTAYSQSYGLSSQASGQSSMMSSIATGGFYPYPDGVSSTPAIQPPQLTPPQTHRQMKAKRRNLDLNNSVPRQAANMKWLDPNLKDWPEDDYRIFVGDLGNEVNDDMLSKTFSMFKSFNKARVVRCNRTGKSRGYGFVSFGDPRDFATALKEKHGAYIGNRPCKLKKSTWKEKNDPNPSRKFKRRTDKKGKGARLPGSVLHK